MSDYTEQCSNCFCFREEWTENGYQYLCYKDYPVYTPHPVSKQAICAAYRQAKEEQ